MFRKGGRSLIVLGVLGVLIFVAVSMFLSGAILWFFGAETHPRLNPAR